MENSIMSISGTHWRSSISVPIIDDDTQHHYFDLKRAVLRSWPSWCYHGINCWRKIVYCWDGYRVVRQRRWGFPPLRQEDITEMDDVTICTCAVPSSPTKLTLYLETLYVKAVKDVREKKEKEFPRKDFRLLSVINLQSRSKTMSDFTSVYVRKADNLTTILDHCHVIWEP